MLKTKSMKKYLLFFILIVLSISASYAQSASDSITAKKVFGGYQFIQDEHPLTVKQLMVSLENNQEAYQIIKSAKGAYDLSNILAGAGGFCIGYPLGTAMGGGEPNWTMAGIGAGLVLIAIPISISFNKRALKAVNIYNQDFRETSFWEDKELKLSLTGNGVGLKLIF